MGLGAVLGTLHERKPRHITSLALLPTQRLVTASRGELDAILEHVRAWRRHAGATGGASGKRRVVEAEVERRETGWRILARAVGAQRVEGGGTSTETTHRGPA